MKLRPYNPFVISDTDASVNVVREEEARRLRKKWKTSLRSRGVKPPDKFVIELDSTTAQFIYEYSLDIKADYSSALIYLLTPLADAYNRDKKEAHFTVNGKWFSKRESYGDIDQDNDR